MPEAFRKLWPTGLAFLGLTVVVTVLYGAATTYRVIVLSSGSQYFALTLTELGLIAMGFTLFGAGLAVESHNGRIEDERYRDARTFMRIVAVSMAMLIVALFFYAPTLQSLTYPVFTFASDVFSGLGMPQGAAALWAILVQLAIVLAAFILIGLVLIYCTTKPARST